MVSAMRRESVEFLMSSQVSFPLALLERAAWMADALCKEYDQDLFFPGRGDSAKAAKQICGRCAVRAECLDYALGFSELQGVWGGASEGERRPLRRKRRAVA